MTDPFDQLRAPVTPRDPDPAFAADLRRRLVRALRLPKGVAPVTEQPTPSPRPAAVPYLAVADARAAIDWYAEIFGATVVGELYEMPDGRVGHAELRIGDGVVYLADENPGLGFTAPRRGESSVSLMLPVDDADEVRARAVAAGAHGDREPYDGYGQRNAWIVDPFGHRWGLHSPLRSAQPRRRHGDVGYVSLHVPDVDRATRFYGAVLGWEITAADGRGRVRGARLSTGLSASSEPPTLFCCYAVDDIGAAVAAVRNAGGRADEPHQRPEGPTADCVDDQGVRFAVYQPIAPDARESGDLAYLTLEAVDGARARDFYGAVLGWRCEPGRVPDGWQVQDTVPMIGIHGGQSRATAVPMWRVSDIETAVAAVRAHGGTASDPETQPYGRSASCTDDQGMRFYLGEV